MFIFVVWARGRGTGDLRCKVVAAFHDEATAFFYTEKEQERRGDTWDVIITQVLLT